MFTRIATGDESCGRDSRALRARLVLACLACGLLAQNLNAGEIRYLKRNERFCDTEEQLCVRGTIRYEVNPRVLRVWGRVQTSPGRGLLRIRLAGTNRLDHRRTTAMEIQLRGTYSEIIEFKMIPDHPDIANWEVTSIEFEPGERSPPAESRDATGKYSLREPPARFL